MNLTERIQPFTDNSASPNSLIIFALSQNQLQTVQTPMTSKYTKIGQPFACTELMVPPEPFRLGCSCMQDFFCCPTRMSTKTWSTLMTSSTNSSDLLDSRCYAPHQLECISKWTWVWLFGITFSQHNRVIGWLNMQGTRLLCNHQILCYTMNRIFFNNNLGPLVRILRTCDGGRDQIHVYGEGRQLGREEQSKKTWLYLGI